MAARGLLTRALAALVLSGALRDGASAAPRTGVRVVPPRGVDTSGNNWPEFRGNDQRTGYNPYQTAITEANVATLAPKWTQKTINGVFANPVVVNGIVYQADDTGNLTAWTLASGAPVWEFSLGVPGESFIATPTYYHGTLYIGSQGLPTAPGSFYAIDASSGHVRWQYTIPNTVPYQGFQGSALVANGLVYEGESGTEELLNTCATTHQLIALSPDSPTVVSSLNLTGSTPGYTGADIWSSPALDPAGNVYVGTGNMCGPSQPLPFSDAILKVSSASSLMRIGWVYQSPFNFHNDLDFGATPLYVNGLIVDGGKDGYVYAIDAATGVLAWKRYVGLMIGSPATDGTRVYEPVDQTRFPRCVVGSVCGALIALNLSDGSLVWSVPTHEDYTNSANLSAPTVSGNMVFAAFDSTIWAFDAATGTKLWSYPAGGLVYGGITVVNGGLLVGTIGSTQFYCFTPGGV